MYFFNTHGFCPKKKILIETHKEDKIRREVAENLLALSIKLPANMYPKNNFIRPYTVSFDIPETENEAFIHIDGLADEKILVHLDVVRKGTRKVFSHYLKGFSEYEFAIFCFRYFYLRNFCLNEIYSSVVFLSKKADEYWSKHLKQ